MNTTPALPARHRAQLIASHLTTDRGGRRILTDVDVTLSAGSRWGIVGENGRGKSTLLQILAGSLNPDSGKVQRIGTIAVVEQEMDFRTDRTVGEVIDDHLASSRAALRALDESADALARDAPGAADRYSAALDAAQALDAWDAERRIDLALDRLGASTERRQPLSTLSIGQRYRVRLACVLGEDADFLLLDEPTNHLDAAGLEYLASCLRDHSGGVAVVSHDRALLAAVATTILDLDPSRDGLPRSYGGGFEAYRAGREAELVRWEADYEQQVSERRKLTQDLSEAQNRLSTGWKPDKGTPRHQRQTRAPGIVRSVNRRRDELDRHTITASVPPPRFRMPDLGSHPGIALLTADGIRVEGRLHEPVEVALESGSRLVITGPNGAGKSTLLTVLAGRLSPTDGVVRTARSARVELLAQESPEPIRGGAADVYAAHVARLVTLGQLAEDEVIPLSQLCLFSASDLSSRVSEFSAGQRRRLDLAMVLAARPDVLLLDEPTNHLSIALVDDLTEALHLTSAAVVLASHDRQLLQDTQAWPRLHLGVREEVRQD